MPYFSLSPPSFSSLDIKPATNNQGFSPCRLAKFSLVWVATLFSPCFHHSRSNLNKMVNQLNSNKNLLRRKLEIIIKLREKSWPMIRALMSDDGYSLRSLAGSQPKLSLFNFSCTKSTSRTSCTKIVTRIKPRTNICWQPQSSRYFADLLGIWWLLTYR